MKIPMSSNLFRGHYLVESHTNEVYPFRKHYPDTNCNVFYSQKSVHKRQHQMDNIWITLCLGHLTEKFSSFSKQSEREEKNRMLDYI